jgi:hypothetical protein
MARASLIVVGDFGDFGQSDNSVHGLGFTSFHGLFIFGKLHQPKNRQLGRLPPFTVSRNHQSPSRSNFGKAFIASRKDTQNSSAAGGVANVYENHQSRARVMV